jgi:broad specificity phosphatase PhoE
MKTLILWRHGRTAWNDTGRAQGHADVPMDEIGHAQAAAAAPALAAMQPAAIWCSDLARARETCAYLEQATGLEATYDKRLREYDVGERSGLTAAEASEKYGVPVTSWWELHEARVVPDAEITADVAARVLPALEEILDDLADGETGVVVAHGACLKVVIAALIGWPSDLAQTMQGMANCAWAIVIEPEPGVRRLVAYNRIAGPDFTSAPEVG